ncbi:mitochondrial import inner membrane translocase subunit Tim9-like [Babylonia areolata]|uniref:mitochondrial import inner membrane translocase subunit Tim9-like n=1 Tax=Babylonia areolata TaxID=304850 RepID=UPI003FD150CC
MNPGIGDGVSLPPNMQVDAQSAAKQFYEFLSQYNRVSEMCFNHCVHDFTTRKVLDAENTCAVTCLEKFLKSVSRISLRFQEIQFPQGANMAQSMTASDSKKV